MIVKDSALSKPPTNDGSFSGPMQETPESVIECWSENYEFMLKMKTKFCNLKRYEILYKTDNPNSFAEFNENTLNRSSKTLELLNL